jgi:hypothetical protein
MSDRETNEQLRWQVNAHACPGEPGSAIVSVQSRNAMVPELAFDMLVDWPPGAEAADVEGRALILCRCCSKRWPPSASRSPASDSTITSDR